MKHHNNHHYILLASISFIVVMGAWFVATHIVAVKEYFLPSPYRVVEATIELFRTRMFLNDIGISALRILGGFLLATAIAVPVGIAIGLNRHAEALLEPMIDFIRYTPTPAFIPLFILWFGIGEWEKVIVIAASVFFQLVLMVANSVSDVPNHIVESSQTLGANQWQTITHVIYPYAQPRIFDDLRVSMGWAWAGLILAEIVGSTSGIGYVIIQSQRLLQTAQVVSAIMIVGLLGLVSDYFFKWLYAISFPWTGHQKNHVTP